MTTYVGSVCTFTQIVGGLNYSGSVCKLQQIVSFRQSYSGSISKFTQIVSGNYAGSICKIQQRVIHATVAGDFFHRNGWDIAITIGAYEITPDMLHGSITINKTEKSNSTCEFTVFIDNPVDFIDQIYDGSQEVVIDYYNGATVYRQITALVDSPEIDMINKTVTIKCSNQRTELINSRLSGIVKTIGSYSKPVLGEFKNVAEELDLRLKTVPASVDFDAYNNVNINYWQAAVSADYILDDVDVYFRRPNITWQNRGDIVNHIQSTLKYKRTRLYHYSRDFDWTASYFGNPTDFGYNLYTSPSVSMVNEATNAATWKRFNPATFVEVYTAASSWFGVAYSTAVTVFTDNSGNTINDSKGDALYSLQPATSNLQTKTPNVNDVHVMRANWSAAIRFSQFLEETYTLDVYAPQSINKNGEVVSYQDVSYEDVYDAQEWENFPKLTSIPAEAVTSDDSYYVDIAELNPGALSQAILTLLAMAKTSILSSHRNTQVEIQGKFIPGLELRHTVQLSLDLIQCKGRVVKIQHVLNAINGDTTTTLTIALSRAPGSTSNTALTVPARPAYTPSIASGTILLGNHYGTPAVEGTVTDTWNGFIGNKAIHFTAGFFNLSYTARTAFTDIFRVDTPAVSDTLRALKELPVSASYNISIPNDTLDMDLS